MGEEVGNPKPMREKRFLTIFLLILAAAGFGQQPSPAPSATPIPDLNIVLAQMDEGGKRFKSAQADFKWETYTAVTTSTDEQTGQIFSRRKNGSQELAIRILTPHPRQALIKGDKAIMYDPRIKQTTERKIGDKADAESVMNMASAFGIKGQDLRGDYDVKLIGWETVDGIKTAKLELVPRKENVKRLVSKVILWIDLKRDVAVQQQRFDHEDYQLAHYTNIKLDGKIPDDVFSIKKGGGE
jgi:outer membrane lipoprotein-sorting protein